MAALGELSVTSNASSLLSEGSLSKARRKRRKNTVKEKKDDVTESLTDQIVSVSVPLKEVQPPHIHEEPPVVAVETPLTDRQNGRQRKGDDKSMTPPPSPPLSRHSEERGEGGAVLPVGADRRGNQEGGEGGEEQPGVRQEENEEEQEDRDHIIALTLTVQYAYPLKAKLSLHSLAVRLSICNRMTSTLLRKSLEDHAAVSFYERDNPTIDYILPVMSQPCYLSSDSYSVLQANWNEDVIICERYSNLFNPHALLLVELLWLSQQATPTPIAWGQVLIGRMPLEQDVRVRMYRTPKRYEHRGVGGSNISSLLNMRRPRNYPTILHLRAQVEDRAELMNTTSDQPINTLRSTSPIVPECSTEGLSGIRHRLKGTSTLHDSINSIDHDTADPQWSRLPGQSCAVPNKVETYLMTGSGGCSTLSFSRSGRFLAAAVEDNNEFVIKIYQVIGWSLLCRLASDSNIIYKLSWSFDDTQLMCASASGLSHVWSFTQDGNSEVLLPHPSYVYCCEWVGGGASDGRGFIVTGCYDGAIRCWRHHQMTHVEVVNYSVNTLTYDIKQSLLYSTDTSGSIKIWSINNDNYSIQLHSSLLLSDYKGSNIRELFLLPWSSQVIVYRPRGRQPLTRLDLRIESISTVYSTSSAVGGVVGGANDSLPYAGVCVSPCGSLLIAVVSSSILIWDTSSGKLIDQFDVSLLRSPGLTCQYHPYEHLLVCSGLGQNQVISVLTSAEK